MVDIETPRGHGQFGPQGHGPQDSRRGLTKIANIQNTEALGLVVSEKIFFSFSNFITHYGPY